MSPELERVRYGKPRFFPARDVDYKIFGLGARFTTAADQDAGQLLAYAKFEALSEFYIANSTMSGEEVGTTARAADPSWRERRQPCQI